MRVAQVKLCGSFGQFDGLQLFLGDPDGSSLQLNPIGQKASCQSWQVPSGQWIEQITVGYNNYSLNFFEIKTNAQSAFSRG